MSRIAPLLLVLALSLLSAAASFGAEEQSAPPTETGAATEVASADNDIEPVDSSEEQTSIPAPEGDNLRSRDIGDAFRNFQPSEEISADNAVTFPVDI